MKSTILSEKDAQLIEKSILQYGRILTIHNLMGIFQGEYSSASAHNRISLLARSGWLRRLKQGLYLIIDSLTARSQVDVSLLSIANALVEDSYVSLSHALNQYQLFDQYSSTVVSITTREQKKHRVDQYTFQYSKVKKDMYFGHTEKLINGKTVRLAEAEKALIDYLYLDNSFGSASLVFEKLRDHHQSLSIDTLQTYALRSGITVQRKVGFLLDALQLDSTKAYQGVNNNRGTSRFTKESKIFNAKWRLYYHHPII